MISMCVLVLGFKLMQDSPSKWPWEAKAFFPRYADGITEYGVNTDAFGYSIDILGDLDNDGFAEFLIGAPGVSNEDRSGIAHGAAFILSGQDGSELRSIAGRRNFEQFGKSVLAIRDIDDDGFCDLLSAGGECSRVSVYSGSSGEQLWTARDQECSLLGEGEICLAGDIDRDGFYDIAVGNATWEQCGPNKGRVTILSGKTGEELGSVLGHSSEEWFGYSVDSGVDIDGDGVEDILASAVMGNIPNRGITRTPGIVRCLSGATGQILYEVQGTQSADMFGFVVRWVGDLDADETRDFVVGAPCVELVDCKQGQSKRGFIVAFSGKTGNELFSFKRPPPVSGFGYSIAPCGDVNGDSREDICVGAYDKTNLFGAAFVVSGYGDAVLWSSNFDFPLGGKVKSLVLDKAMWIVISATNRTFQTPSRGQVRAINIKSGKTIVLERAE